jgi:hypothetical protein
MKCGFFDLEKGSMVEVEESEFSRHMGELVAMQLKTLWESGRHCMPSPYWCMWDACGHD